MKKVSIEHAREGYQIICHETFDVLGYSNTIAGAEEFCAAMKYTVVSTPLKPKQKR